MQFESDCVFALFDTHHLQDVLKGKMGGSMFGIVQQTDKILNLTKKGNPHVTHNPNKEAEEEGRRAERLDREEEEEETEHRRRASGFSHSHGHNHGHRPKRGKAESGEEQVSHGHFGGEPTLRRSNERVQADDATELLESYSLAYIQQQQQHQRHAHGVDQGQDEADSNTMDRESGQDTQPEQSEQPERSRTYHHGGRSGSTEVGASRGTSAQLPYRRDSSYAEKQSDEEAERQAEADIMNAIRAAYQREQTRKRSPSQKDNNQQVNRDEREGRTADQSDIAAAIHHALKTVGDRDTVKAMVLRCLQTLEDEEAEEVKAAAAAGADQQAVKEEKDRDVRIVEQETGRMWRQQSANQTTEEVTDSIEKFIDGLKGRGEKVVNSLSKHQQTDDVQRLDVQQEDSGNRDSGHEAGTAMGGQHLLFGVMVGVVLGVLLCMAGTYLWMRQKERNDYLEL